VYYGSGSTDQNLAFCPFLRAKIFRPNVVAAHLFKREWWEDIYTILEIEDIDDVKNLFPMCRPIEWAFDTGRLCVLIDGENKMRVHIFDKSICDKSVIKKGEERSDWHHGQKVSPVLRGLTFGDVERRELLLPERAQGMPYRRAFNFQARVTRDAAIAKGWQQDGASFSSCTPIVWVFATLTSFAAWNFDDFWSEDAKSVKSVLEWVDNLRKTSEQSSIAVPSLGAGAVGIGKVKGALE
jgi:hypothetical protein